MDTLKNKKFANKELVDYVLTFLEEKRTDDLRIKYIHLFPVIYSTKYFLISSFVKNEISDTSAVLDEDYEYSLYISPGVFENRQINSPVEYLQEQLKTQIESDDDHSDKDRVEFDSLFLHSVISSIL